MYEKTKFLEKYNFSKCFNNSFLMYLWNNLKNKYRKIDLKVCNNVSIKERILKLSIT